MDRPRLGGKMNRRRVLKTAAATTALTAWPLKLPAPARAQGRADRARAAESNPKRGGVLKWAGPAEVAHFDVHQGAFRFVLGQMYNLSLIHISEPTRLLSISYAVFCLKKKK